VYWFSSIAAGKKEESDKQASESVRNMGENSARGTNDPWHV